MRYHFGRRKEHTDMAAKKPPKKSATPKNKQPRKFPPAQKGDYLKPDDAGVLKDGETRVRTK